MHLLPNNYHNQQKSLAWQTALLWKEARRNKSSHAKQYIAQANNERSETHISINDTVRKIAYPTSVRDERSRKLCYKYSEPFKVDEIFDNGNIRIRSNSQSSETEIIQKTEVVLVKSHNNRPIRRTERKYRF
ncbi:hypothetical protein SNEBB_009402 [Seison nebaliae]|nr:hypothetical protein SNEBB_009402 [Seison nebaliae]